MELLPALPGRCRPTPARQGRQRLGANGTGRCLNSPPTAIRWEIASGIAVRAQIKAGNTCVWKQLGLLGVTLKDATAAEQDRPDVAQARAERRPTLTFAEPRKAGLHRRDFV